MIRFGRTCVGCKNVAPRQSLLRVVFAEHKLICDDSGICPGRGSWVHENAECLSKALSRRAFTRALKVSADTDTSAIENRLKLIMDRR
ncbi:YlxR family protein [Canibacter zhuwentaonis]|uniref:YlxR family protein n=1 Tax=Canibacter zhuwentaonis TaxID=2837491 RepID=UPI0020281819|nr:YlxR family protein [Canibacter zhuwentaonis]